MAALTAALMTLQGAQAVSQYSQQKRSANYEAAIAGQNADLADTQAAQAIVRGTQQANQVRANTRQVLGAQRTGYAASGVDVATGSPVDVAGSTAGVGELDAMTLQNNAALSAYGYQVQGANYRAEQANAKQRGKDSWTTLLTGATNMFGTYAANRSSDSPQQQADKTYAGWGSGLDGINRVRIGRK